MPGIATDTNTNYRNGLAPPRPRDPLAIDLDGDGIETVGVGATPILFDHNADGIRTGTGWVRPDDAWLVLDRDGNGLIDTGRELFGVDTLLSGTPGIDAVYAATGFAALAALNSNGDGVFDASDAAFGTVRLWQDLNQDGVSQAGELSTLAQKNILSIGLAASTSTVNLGNGNTVTGQAVVTRTNGSTTQIDSVAVGADTTAGNLNLANNPFYRAFSTEIPFTDQAQALPEMQGSGAVRDLREAMSLGNSASAALVSAAQAFAQGSTRDAQQASLDELLRTWAATEAVADFNIEAVGQETRVFKVAGSTDAALQAKLTRIIPVLEVFNAAKVEDAAGSWTPTTSVVNGTTIRTYNITAQQATLMQASYDALRNSVYSSLVVQTRLKPYLDGIELVIDGAGIRFDTTNLGAALDAAKAANERNGILDLVELVRHAGSTLQAVGFDALGKLAPWVSALPSGSALSAELPGLDVYTGAVSAGTARNDIYLGTAAAETFAGGNGNDSLDGGAGTDSLYGGAGDDTLKGGTGNDTLYGENGNDTLDGGAGNDTLTGGAGNNTYLFGKGDGVDTIANFSDTTVGKSNVLRMKPGVLPSEVSLKQVYSGFWGWNADLEVSFIDINGVTDKITIGAGWRAISLNDAEYSGVQRIEFADGTTWGYEQIKAEIFKGTPTADSLRGTESADTIYGQAGTDNLSGRNGDDVIYGGADNDTLYGENGNDTLDGGAGNDTLNGGTGNNTYLFGKGDGVDTIANVSDLTVGKSNVLRLKSGVVPSEVSLKQVYSGFWGWNADLEVSFVGVNGVTDKVTIGGGWRAISVSDAEWGTVQSFRFEDGTTWDLVTIRAMFAANTVNGTFAGESLAGTSLGDRISGLDGNDTLTGLADSDWLDGGTGNDALTGGTGDDVYVVDSAGDTIAELANEGTDTVRSSITWTLGAELENLVLTGNLAINGTGNAAANRLFGNSAANRLDGGAGADVLSGADGNDTYVVDNAGDSAVEGSGGGIDTIESSISWTLGAELENLLLTGTSALNGTGNALANTITGNSGINTLTGGAGNDTLNGGLGADALVGGAGNDTYVVDNLGDIVTEITGEGTDTVEASLSWALGAEVENLRLSGTATINATGNSLANTLTGNGGANTLIGGAGNDTLDGGAGVDSLLGGTGNDTYVVDNAADTLAELAAEGIDTVNASLTWTLGTEFENLTLTGGAAISGTGNALANVITGNSGSNRLDGAAGADALFGGAGNDIYVVDSAGDTTVELTAGGIDTVESSITWTLAADTENLTLIAGTAPQNGTGNALNNRLLGNAGINVLSGGAGNDWLRGVIGADTLLGGAGNDEYIVDDALAVVTELAGEGYDSVYSSTTRTITANIEALVLTGSTAINGTGNELGNRMNGASNTSANVLTGGLGDDTYVVGAGDTTIEVAGGGNDTVEASISWTLGAELENLTLTGTEALNGTGNSVSNTLTGNAAANVLVGGAGNDWINGIDGADTMVGGIGNDHYVVDNVADIVTELAAEGVDQVYAKVNWTLGAQLENLILWGTSALTGSGNELANRLTGSDAANVLNGLGSDDTLYGAAGSDALYGGTGNDSLVADARPETIVVKARASLAGNVGAIMEVRLDGALIGSALVSSTTFADYSFSTAVSAGKDAKLDVVFTNDALIDGLDRNLFIDSVRVGSHVMRPTDAGVTRDIGSGVAAFDGVNVLPGDVGLFWDASLRFTVPAAVVGAAAGDDLLYGETGNDYLSGGLGNDRLDGGADADTLDGGGGNDTYIGGLGSDVLTDASTLSNDVYVWGRGEGADVLTDAGGVDRIDVLAGAADSQIWLRQVGSNLELSVIGTADSLTISNWYANSANRIESFKLADGQALMASQVQQLVDAMAAFAPPAAGQTTLPANYQTALNPVIAPSWA